MSKGCGCGGNANIGNAYGGAADLSKSEDWIKNQFWKATKFGGGTSLGYMLANMAALKIDADKKYVGFLAGAEVILSIALRYALPPDWAGGFVDGFVVGTGTRGGVYVTKSLSKAFADAAGINGLPNIGSFLGSSYPLGAQAPAQMPSLNQI
ncbi:MAG: hypothetical protein RLZZ628_2883 [Bacteroidota bacterium]|jgi:hypothetical protein